MQRAKAPATALWAFAAATAVACGSEATAPGNDEDNPGQAPTFTSTPVTFVDHNRVYLYNVTATGADQLSATTPAWLNFNAATGALTGAAGWDNAEASFAVAIIATNSVGTNTQNFSVGVGRGEIICDEGFDDQATSPYVLPYAVGELFGVMQGNCFANGGHNLTFAYDFNTAIGDTIRAARAGVVFSVQESFVDGDNASGNENNVFIEHADGTAVRYTHLMLNGALVQVGDVVTQGQPIALSGNTGATGGVPHLHFAVYRAPGNYTRKFSLPVNFRNAIGNLGARGEPLGGQSYEAGAFTPDGR
ncbi:MAG: M23 family metallopeptidase [Gemmatimonadota bacterium]